MHEHDALASGTEPLQTRSNRASIQIELAKRDLVLDVFAVTQVHSRRHVRCDVRTATEQLDEIRCSHAGNHR